MTMCVLVFICLLPTVFLSVGSLARAQQPKAYRVGAIHQGGPYYTVIDGLRDRLRELGLKEGKHFILEIRDAKGDLKSVEKAAIDFEREKTGLLYSVTSSVTLAAKRVTTEIPIVFCVGSDPVALGLVESFAKPGGRLTGVHFLASDLTAKRLEILKEIFPKLRTVVTLYDPSNRVAAGAAKLGRDEAKRLGLKFVERHASSIEEIRRSLESLKAAEADAFFYVNDAMVNSQAQLIIETARTNGWPTMFQESSLVAKGGLAAYGVSFYEIGRMSARYLQRIFAGAHPKDIAIENFYRLELVINLKTAKQIGLTIPPNVLARADKVIR